MAPTIVYDQQAILLTMVASHSSYILCGEQEEGDSQKGMAINMWIYNTSKF